MARPTSPAPRGSVYLQPGEVFASGDPHAVSTILGSCVAVCLWDAEARVGGVNHYLLPHYLSGDKASPRFGGGAMELLVRKVTALGADPRRLRAKAFGGACVLNGVHGQPIGQKNVRVALRFLEERGIPLVAQELGGGRGRKLVFHTDTGDAWVKQL